MKKLAFASAVLIFFLTLSGCIVHDALTTFTINPDGSADLLMFYSNVHSTQSGAAGEKELADYKRAFDAREGEPFTGIQEAGGKILEASWIRPEPPYSSFIHAHLPNATSLEKYATRDEGQESWKLTTRFRSEGRQRTLEIRLTPPLEAKSPQPSPTEDENPRQGLANGISEIRFAVVKGAITSAEGFTVASDKQSALLDLSRIIAILRNQKQEATLFLKWEVRE